MIIITRSSRIRYLFNILLTILGWAMFFFLFGAGIINILTGEARGPEAPLLPQELRDALSSAAAYTVIMLLFAVILILWFKYNEYYGKYGKYGRYRRQDIAAISREQLRLSLGVTHLQFDTAQAARISVVHHDENGAVFDVRAIER